MGAGFGFQEGEGYNQSGYGSRSQETRATQNMMNDKQLYDLINTDSPKEVLDEVRIILNMISPDFDQDPVAEAFHIIVGLYEGKHPGFKACNTEYHDLRHTIETFLAMARLLHGAQLNGEGFAEPNIALGLITALFHDVGYIQEDHDGQGTGAKYTVHHEQRSVHLLERFAPEFGLSEGDIAAGRIMILGTDISIDHSKLTFPSAQVKLLCQMLTASDLMAQMADRSYLEKLLFLYHEFKEADVGGYESELDLLKKTVTFYKFVTERLESILDKVDRFMTSHFILRWDISSNLYQEAIERQKNYLNQILHTPDLDPRDQLKRAGIVQKVREKYEKK